MSFVAILEELGVIVHSPEFKQKTVEYYDRFCAEFTDEEGNKLMSKRTDGDDDDDDDDDGDDDSGSDSSSFTPPKGAEIHNEFQQMIEDTVQQSLGPEKYEALCGGLLEFTYISGRGMVGASAKAADAVEVLQSATDFQVFKTAMFSKRIAARSARQITESTGALDIGDEITGAVQHSQAASEAHGQQTLVATSFGATLEELADIVHSLEFNQKSVEYYERFYTEFADDEKKDLVHTAIHIEYQQMVEEAVQQSLGVEKYLNLCDGLLEYINRGGGMNGLSEKASDAMNVLHCATDFEIFKTCMNAAHAGGCRVASATNIDEAEQLSEAVSEADNWLALVSKAFRANLEELGDLVHSPEFKQKNASYYARFCVEFTDDEKNELVHAAIHSEYQQMVEDTVQLSLGSEKYQVLCGGLFEYVNDEMGMIGCSKTASDAVDVLHGATDFEAFKTAMILKHNAACAGNRKITELAAVLEIEDAIPSHTELAGVLDIKDAIMCGGQLLQVAKKSASEADGWQTVVNEDSLILMVKPQENGNGSFVRYTYAIPLPLEQAVDWVLTQ